MSIAILGLDINDYSTSAALVADGKIIAAAQEERFNREKRTRRFPVEATRFCLKQAGLSVPDLDAVAVSVNPTIYLEKLQPVQSERVRFRGELLYSPLNYLLGTFGAETGSETLLRLNGLDVYYVIHHDCHAAAGYYPSPYDSAAVCTIDGFGEKETCVLYSAAGTRVERLRSVEFPHSVGCFYAAMTAFLGMQPFRHEWKLMAAAANGRSERLISRMRSLIVYTGEGSFEVNLPFFNYYQLHRSSYFTPKLVELLGEPYVPGNERDERFFDIAAATQKVTEEVVFGILGHLHSLNGGENLCLSGGVAYNCLLNGKAAQSTPFRNVFVPPMPDDSGTSIGAALAVYHRHFGHGRSESISGSYFGPAFSGEEIEAELVRAGVRYRKSAAVEVEAAEAVAGGGLIGWFQGAMEFGNRALGNRSILADPRDPLVSSRLSALVKDREKYQPFAPSVLAERFADFFIDPQPSPFMEKTFVCRPEKRGAIPAVLGADHSARIQTVTREQNRRFHGLLREFERITGVPMVLNTSFNLHGEPIVCSPRDALRTFFSSGLTALFLGDFVVEK